ncbi:type I restriction enzyme, S subunit [Enterococcus sp. AZ140]|uniref:restriction endonuclease subunit S n=1 Tax=Enterococcus sp. AZ140 TaxID=2774731 RepID=UPI003F295425
MNNDTQPEIRFPGFTEDWEQRELSDISTKVQTKNKDREFTETLTNSAEFGIISQNDFFDKEISNKNNIDGYYVVKPNDFVYNPRISNFAPVGPIKRNKLGRTGVMSPLYYVFSTNNIDNQYLETYFSTSYWHKFMKLNGDSGARADRFAIRDSVFVKMPIPYPSREEQEKIGQFFEVLSNAIDLQQRKLDLLKETKKGFLQKMFPENGAKVPEVRFPGFTGDWEDRKLGEVVVFLNGRAFKQQELLDSGKYRVLRVGNFNTNDRWYYSNLELEEDKYANKGDLLYLWATSFGPEMWNEERVIYHYHIWKLKFLSKELDKQYLYTWLLTDKEKIKESTNGTTMVHVTKGGIEQRTFQFPPDINEQQKIGNFFKQLDDTIALHQRKLDLLKETKKGFLQKMFV